MKIYNVGGVIIEGHADETTSRHQNYILGIKRAETAKKYLVKLGIKADRLTVVSYGDYQPIASTPDSHASNRRVVSITQADISMIEMNHRFLIDQASASNPQN